MKQMKNQVCTIPNLLSLIRILMIPLIVLLYWNGSYGWTAAMILLSGLTDVVDGWIARRFGQISDLGKVLDPIADKLTQAVTLFCLASSFKGLIVPLILLLLKELFAGISGLLVIKHAGYVPGAQWHGKMTTLLLYGMMFLHLIWQEIPGWTSNLLSAVCAAMMLVSFALYAKRNIQAIRAAAEKTV